MVESGHFAKLWFRLNVFPIIIPPLRHRREDIPALVQYFIDKKSRQFRLKERPVFATGVMDRLREYSWPGNVRELENVIERELILNGSGLLRFDNLVKPQQDKPGPACSDDSGPKSVLRGIHDRPTYPADIK